MFAIDQEIDAFNKETQDSVDCIIEGSDEHLDLILTYSKPLDLLSKKFEKLNESLYNNIGNTSDEDIKNIILPKLLEVNKNCMMLLGAVRTSFLYRDVRASFKNFSKNHDFLREIIHDLKYFRLNKDADFDNLLRELNEM